MRIALLCADRGVPLGGTRGGSVQLRSVAAALLRAGHAVSAWMAEPGPGDALDTLLRDGLTITTLPDRPTVAGLRAEMERARPDLVLERLTLLSPTGAEAAAALGVPHLYEVRAPLGDGATAAGGVSTLASAHAGFAAGFSCSAGSVVPTDEVAQWVGRHARPDFPIRVLPGGADPEFLAPPDPDALDEMRLRLGPSPGLRVGFAGILHPWHDLETLVRAIGHLPWPLRAQLVLIGDGPRRNALLALAARSRVRLHLTGMVPHRLVPACMSLCDVMVVPCARDDAHFSPLRLVEAMAAGRAVVAGATRPCSQLLWNGIEGLLVPPGDALALAAALERIAHDRALCARLGEAARRSAAARYSWDTVVRQLLDFAMESAPLRNGT